MRAFKIIVTFSLLIILTSFNSKMKVSFIYIKKELDIAKVIQEIRIYGYSDSAMLYGTTNSRDTLTIKSNRGKFLNLKEAVKINSDGMLKNELGGKWPEVGQRVLVIIDTTLSIRLFAFKTDDQYRFWDPNSIPFANSIFLIPKEKSFKQLPICLDYLGDKTDFWSCSDGCLVNIESVKQRN